MSLRTYRTDAGLVLVCDLDTLPMARLKKMNTENGLWAMVEGKAYVGKRYKYSPASREVREFVYSPTGQKHHADTVLVYDERGIFALMPVEVLDFAPAVPPTQ